MEVNIFGLNQRVALKQAIMEMEPCKFPEFWEMQTSIDNVLIFTVSGNIFPTLCMHLWFHVFLPLLVFSSCFWKKLEGIPFSQFLPFFREVSEPRLPLIVTFFFFVLCQSWLEILSEYVCKIATLRHPVMILLGHHTLLMHLAIEWSVFGH